MIFTFSVKREGIDYPNFREVRVIEQRRVASANSISCFQTVDLHVLISPDVILLFGIGMHYATSALVGHVGIQDK